MGIWIKELRMILPSINNYFQAIIFFYKVLFCFQFIIIRPIIFPKNNCVIYSIAFQILLQLLFADIFLIVLLPSKVLIYFLNLIKLCSVRVKFFKSIKNLCSYPPMEIYIILIFRILNSLSSFSCFEHILKWLRLYLFFFILNFV